MYFSKLSLNFMSLKEKLGGLTKNLEEQKKTQKQSEEDERLAPVRANIKELQKSLKGLDLIKNSLDFKETDKPEDHVGMKDYAEKTDKNIKSKSGEIDSLILENKEALNNLGIEDRNQLSSHPEFAEEKEVIEYKKSLDQGEGLKMSDTKLKNRLTKLGVEFDIENFSYELASESLSKKIEEVNDDIRQEKLKTPEGREEIINNLAKEFEKSTGKMELNTINIYDKNSDPGGFNRDKPDYSYRFETDRSGFSVNFKDEKAKVTDWWSLTLLPDNFKNTEDKYGEEITHEALEKAYQNKVHDNFSKWDENSDKAVSLREQIKAVSPKERRAAQIKLDEFTEKQNELLQALREKSEELKGKGIDFSPDYASGFGGKYKEIIDLDSRGSINYISESLNKNDFPPQHDFIKLQEATDKRIKQVDKFIEVIKNINDKEDVENLLENRDSDIYISKFHKDTLHANFREDIQFELKGNNNFGAVSKLKEKCKTYQQAEDYLDKIIEKNAEGESRVSEAMIATVKAYLKLRELESEIKQEKIGERINDLERKIERIADDKRAATKVMGEIESLQSKLSSDPKLSEESLVLSNSYLVVPSIKKEYDDLRENKPLKQKEWENKKGERERFETTKPGLFGKEKWQAKLTKLKDEEATAETEYRSLEKINLDSLYLEAYHFVGFDQYSTVGKMVKEFKSQGKSSEVFNDLKMSLTTVIDSAVSPKIMADYVEYKTLVEKIG